MTTHDRAQSRVNWYKKTEGGEMACITRKKVYDLDATLGESVDEKIDGGCENIIPAITLVLRTKSERASRQHKERIETIVQEAKPGPPMKTIRREIHMKGTETCKRTKPDGTVEEVTRDFEEDVEEDVPADMWRGEQKRQKTTSDSLDSAIGP